MRDDNFLDDVLDRFDPSLAADEQIDTDVQNDQDRGDERDQQQQQPTGQNQPAQKDDDDNVDPLTGQRLDDKPAQKTDNKKPGKDAKPDNKQQQQQQLRHGDVRDPRTGEIIRAGAERRHYDARRAAEGKLAEASQRLQEATRQIQSYQQAFALPAQLGLQPQEAAFGAQLVAALKRDPLNTIRDLLTAAQSRGHNVSEFLGQQAGNINTGAITQQVQQLTAPLMQEMQNRRAWEQAQQHADQELSTFMNDNPLAGAHHEAIADLMDARGWSMGQAWNHIQGFVLEHGLDIRKSLKEQQMPGSEQQQQAQQRGNGRTQQRPIVGGNGVGTPTQQRNVRPANGHASHSTRNSDIVRAAMAEAGYDTSRF